MNNTSKRTNRIKRHTRVRAKIAGTAHRPRLAVFRSNKHIHLQLIDDDAGRTLAAASTVKDKDAAKALALKAGKLGVKSIVFDRGGYRYHGKIAKVADAIRSAGLTF